MFAIVKNQPEKGLWSEDRNVIQKLGPNDVRVKVSHAGICGTDMHIYNWDDWAQGRVKVPTVLGHEFVGTIVETGMEVKHLEKGQRVSAECHVTCGVCKFCRTGQGHICSDTSIIGVDRDGAFAEEVVVPAGNIWPVHADIPSHHAAVFDPTGNAMHTVMATPVAGAHVLISGAGAIGLFATAIAKTFGARTITVLEPQQFKRDLAMELGADLALNPLEDGFENEIKTLTDGIGPDVLLEMSGNEKAIDTGLALMANGGTAAMLGLPASRINFDMADKLIFKGITMKGIVGRKMYETWYQVDAFMRKAPEAMDKVITHVLPMDEFDQGFAMMEQGTCGKVVLSFDETK